MKLNYRDKVILLVLLLVAVWVVGIMFFIKPGIDDINDAKNERESLKATLKERQDKIESQKNLKNEIKESYKNAGKYTECFYDYMLSQDASQLVDDLLDEDEITNLNMEVSEYSSRALVPYAFVTRRITTSNDQQVLDYKNAESNVAAEQAASSSADSTASTSSAANTAAANTNGTTGTNGTTVDQTVACYTMSLDYQGDYDDLKEFCQKLTVNTEKSLVITGLEMTYANADYDENNENAKKKPYEIEGTITFDMMMIRKLPALSN
ncbi:MAG: hypothetical protein ACI4I6_04055 [Hominimerdicola sp.]